MTFTDAWAWWIGVPFVVLMLVWHLLRSRVTPTIVPSLQLWQHVHSEQTSRRPLTWPTPWWVVLVRTLICLLLVCAAAGPVWSDATTNPTRVIVIDTSVSMRTQTALGQRIELAKNAAHALIADAPVGTMYTIAELSHTVIIHANLVSDRATAQRAVDAVQTTNIAVDVPALLPFIQYMDNQRSDIFVVSDDASLWQPARWPTTWHRVPIGGNAANQSIQGMSLQATSTGWHGVVRVEADGAAFINARLLEVRDIAGTLYAATYVSPRAAASVLWEFDIPRAPALLVASLRPDPYDALPADDTFWWSQPPQHTLNVYVASADTRFLPAALRILPNVVRVARLADADMAIIDTPLTVPTVITMPTWLINPPAPVQVSFPFVLPSVLHGDVALLGRDIDLQSTQILTASVLTEPFWAQRWLQSTAGTHAYAGFDHGVPSVVSGFALTHSDLPLRPDFPLLVRNIIHFLAPATRADSLQTGQVQALADTGVPSPTLVRRPANSSATLRAQDGMWYLVGIDQIGAYEVDQQTYVANILAPWESATQRPDTVSTWQSMSGRVQLSGRTWAIWCALLLLMLERGLMWYTRRMT